MSLFIHLQELQLNKALESWEVENKFLVYTEVPTTLYLFMIKHLYFIL